MRDYLSYLVSHWMKCYLSYLFISATAVEAGEISSSATDTSFSSSWNDALIAGKRRPRITSQTGIQIHELKRAMILTTGDQTDHDCNNLKHWEINSIKLKQPISKLNLAKFLLNVISPSKECLCDFAISTYKVVNMPKKHNHSNASTHVTNPGN